MTNSATSRPRVHYATYLNEDTGETTPYFLYSHEEIDAEIDQRIRADRARTAHHEVMRAKFHAALVADSAPSETFGAGKKMHESAAI